MNGNIYEKYTSSHLLQISYDFLACYCSRKDLDTAVNDMLKNYPINREAFFSENRETIDLFHKMQKDSISSLSDIDEDIRFYFATPDSEGKYEAAYGVLTLQSGIFANLTGTLDEYMTKLTEISDKEYHQKLYGILSSYNNTIIKSDTVQTPFTGVTDVVNHILQMDIPTEVKWRLQDFYFHRTEHLKKLRSIFERIISFISEYENELDKLFSRFFSYWEQCIGARDFYSFLKEDFSLLPDMEINPFGYTLRPSLFPFGFSLEAPFDETTGEYTKSSTLTLGVLYGSALTPNTVLSSFDPGQNEEKCLDAIKLLADPSRFEILKYISNKEAYASEIANHLGLTSATVSHHMGILYASDIVTITKTNNKLYYKLNKETLKKYLSYFENKLTTN